MGHAVIISRCLRAFGVCDFAGSETRQGFALPELSGGGLHLHRGKLLGEDGADAGKPRATGRTL